VRWDLPDGFIEKANEFLNDFPTKISEYEQLLTNNPIWLERTKGVGVISAEEAINYGLTGPSLRGSGMKWDLRKAQPYSIYDRFDFEIPIGKAGDTYDRYLVRLEEMRQSSRIIRQALEKIPKEPIAEPTADGQPVQVPKKKASTFGVGKKFKVPPGEAYVGTEAPKGELGFYVISDGSTNPYRVKIRAPSFVNLQTLNMMVKGRLYADVVAIIGTLDIVLGELDR
jgi:NADH:ubiquinone oxidoreductase subunit D